MWELECKEGEHQRINVFELWYWKRLLRIPWTARRSIQSVLKEINPEYSLEGLMLMLKLQYFGHLMWRTDSVEKTLMLGKIEGRRRRGRQMMRSFDGITNSLDMGLGKLWEMVRGREPWRAAVYGVTKNWTQLSNNPLGRRRMVRKLEPFLHGVTSEVRMGQCYQITDIHIMIHNL